MSSLKAIEGIGAIYEEKLKNAGISSIEDLLATCAAKKDRAEIAETTGIPEKLILKWTNHADLHRIKGVAGEYAELLEAAGVDTVPELAQRNPGNLLAKLAEINSDKKLVRHLPNEKQLADWIEHAKQLPRIMMY
jgi:predicted flap endonuclease-1-like 5' DNA nuclease